MRLHDVIDQIPVSFQLPYNEKKECWCIHKETINYELQIEVWEFSTMHWKRYRQFNIYYSPRYYSQFEKRPPVIWNKCGKWIERENDSNFSDCLENLKNELKEKWVLDHKNK